MLRITLQAEEAQARQKAEKEQRLQEKKEREAQAAAAAEPTPKVCLYLWPDYGLSFVYRVCCLPFSSSRSSFLHSFLFLSVIAPLCTLFLLFAHTFLLSLSRSVSLHLASFTECRYYYWNSIFFYPPPHPLLPWPTKRSPLTAGYTCSAAVGQRQCSRASCSRGAYSHAAVNRCCPSGTWARGPGRLEGPILHLLRQAGRCRQKPCLSPPRLRVLLHGVPAYTQGCSCALTTMLCC